MDPIKTQQINVLILNGMSIREVCNCWSRIKNVKKGEVSFNPKQKALKPRWGKERVLVKWSPNMWM